MGSKASCRWVLALSVLCAGLSLGQGGQVVHTLSPISSAFSAGIRQFAVEDFDGDHKPDIAEVQIGRTDSHSTHYSIRVRLTSGTNQSIGVNASFGGLEIIPRDVNGDNALDLVVSTALQHEPVAILLNDGHGNFSQAEPSSFPEAFSKSDTNLHAASTRVIDAVGIPPQPNSGVYLQAEGLPNLQRRADLISVLCSGFPPSSFLSSQAGRAPPAEA
jgi:hypothetical protein